MALVSKNIHTPVFTAALFTIAKTWETQMSTNSSVVKEDALSSVYTDTHTQIEYYSVIRKNKMMPLAAMQMNLEIIILSEVSQRGKDKYHMVSLICEI